MDSAAPSLKAPPPRILHIVVQMEPTREGRWRKAGAIAFGHNHEGRAQGFGIVVSLGVRLYRQSRCSPGMIATKYTLPIGRVWQSCKYIEVESHQGSIA